MPMQDIPVNIQGNYFLITVVLGIVVGLLFDLNRTCRYFWRPRRHLAVFLDLLFCLVATVVVYAGLLLANWGEVRFYVFIGMVLGLALYYLTVSRFILLLMRRFFALGLTVLKTLHRGVTWGVTWLIRLISIPLRPFIFLSRLLKGCFVKTKGNIGKIGTHVRKKFRNIFSKRKS
jgi:spore cortex biosynthesis protein YabQ